MASNANDNSYVVQVTVIDSGMLTDFQTIIVTVKRGDKEIDYKVKLGADDTFLGVHKSLRFDINGLGEILMKQMVNRAAGSEVSMYDDISYMISPQHGARNRNHAQRLHLSDLRRHRPGRARHLAAERPRVLPSLPEMSG